MFDTFADEPVKEFSELGRGTRTQERISLGDVVSQFFAARGEGDENRASAFRAGIVVKSRSAKLTTKHHRR